MVPIIIGDVTFEIMVLNFSHAAFNRLNLPGWNTEIIIKITEEMNMINAIDEWFFEKAKNESKTKINAKKRPKVLFEPLVGPAMWEIITRKTGFVSLPCGL